jgi:hypothetical protein
MTPKPPWLLYAAQVSKELEDVRSTKSGKPYDRHLYSSWLEATSKHGYEGTEKEWDFLVHNFDKVNKLKRPGRFG